MDFITFNEEILNGILNFLCSVAALFNKIKFVGGIEFYILTSNFIKYLGTCCDHVELE